MKRWIVALAAVGIAAAPAESEAQSRDGWWDWALSRVAGGEVVRTERGAYRVPTSAIDRGGEWNRRRTGQDGRAEDRRDDPRADRDGGIFDRIPDVIRGDRDRDRRNRDRDRRDRDRRRGDRDDDSDSDSESDSEDWRADRDRRGNGPAFCRDGSGHPVHGWDWCEDRGWDRGDARRDRRSDDVRWDRRTWEDIILGGDRDRRYGAMSGGDLRGVLGDVVLGRLLREGGATGELSGRWLRSGTGANVLQLRAGGRPLAELSDLDGDRRVDVALVARR